MADRKAKASSAFHEPQLLPRKPRPLQSKVSPQLPPSQSTSRPKAANQQNEMTRSTGQWMKLPEKGSSQRSASRIESPATTSVYIKRPSVQDDCPRLACRWFPVIPATMAAKASYMGKSADMSECGLGCCSDEERTSARRNITETRSVKIMMMSLSAVDLVKGRRSLNRFNTALQSRHCGGWGSRRGEERNRKVPQRVAIYYSTCQPSVPPKSLAESQALLLNRLQASLDQSQSHPRSRRVRRAPYLPGIGIGIWVPGTHVTVTTAGHNRDEAIRVSTGYLSSHHACCLTL